MEIGRRDLSRHLAVDLRVATPGVSIREAITQVPAGRQAMFLVGEKGVSLHTLPALEAERHVATIGVGDRHPLPVRHIITGIVATQAQSEAGEIARRDVMEPRVVAFHQPARLIVARRQGLRPVERLEAATIGQLQLVPVVGTILERQPGLMRPSFRAHLLVVAYLVSLTIQRMARVEVDLREALVHHRLIKQVERHLRALVTEIAAQAAIVVILVDIIS